MFIYSKSYNGILVQGTIKFHSGFIMKIGSAINKNTTYVERNTDFQVSMCKKKSNIFWNNIENIQSFRVQ